MGSNGIWGLYQRGRELDEVKTEYMDGIIKVHISVSALRKILKEPYLEIIKGVIVLLGVQIND